MSDSVAVAVVDAAAVEPQEEERSQQVAEEIAREVLQISRDDAIEHAKRVGESIIKRGFNGDPQVYLRRNKGDQMLDRVVAALKRLQGGPPNWKKSTVSRAVHVYLQSIEFGGFDAWPSLDVSHLYVVQPLTYLQQRKLLTEAQDRLWTVADLRAAVEALQGKERRQRPVKDYELALRAMSRFEKSLASRADLVKLLRSMSIVTPNASDEVAKSLEALAAAINSVKDQIARMTSEPNRTVKRRKKA